MPTQAVIFAAGHGTRLGNLTQNTPKPLLPVQGHPGICWILKHLRDHGYERVIINLHHYGEMIKKTLYHHYNGIEIQYFEEPKLLGSGGTLQALYLQGLLDREFLIWYGDTLSNLDLNHLEMVHQYHHGDATLAGYNHENPQPFGQLLVHPDNRLYGVKEKSEVVHSKLVWGGVGILKRSILGGQQLPPPADISRDLIPKWLYEDKRIYVSEDILASYLDFGTPEGYQAAQELTFLQ